jgi:hypothetical protein
VTLIRSSLLFLCAAWAFSFNPVWAAGSPSVFKIYIEHDGVYEIPFHRLAVAGLVESLPSAGIGLRNFGEPVPIWIEDGDDGHFDPGDRILFMGEALRGEYSHFDPYSRFNCFVLDFFDHAPWIGLSQPSAIGLSGEPGPLLAQHHLESDRVMARFRSGRDEPDENWYWARISVSDRMPFIQELALEGLSRASQKRPQKPFIAHAPSETDREGENRGSDRLWKIGFEVGSVSNLEPSPPMPVRIRLGLRGWSNPRHRERSAMPHHEVLVSFNKEPVSRAIWNGKGHYIHEVEIPTAQFLEGDNELALKVPKRRYPESGDLLIDVVLLNWIELEYQHTPRLLDEQLRLRLADSATDRTVKIAAEDGGPIDLYLPGGVRLSAADGVVEAVIADDVTEFSVLRPNAAAAVTDVVADRPSNLASGDRQVDYIMITHRSLREGTERLAELHRSRGLSVEVVDVQDVYDEFNFGMVHPRAIKDFLQHAFLTRRAPAPRFVLLVGDASWDFKNITADDSKYADWTYRPGEKRRFVKNSSTPYAEGTELNHRNLVPTSSYQTFEGHAASDTWFVCFDDGDTLPDMAIGRLPVVTEAELHGIIDKTIEFAAAPPVGPWRRNLLLIANESAVSQRRSDLIAETFGQLGFVPTRIYPHPSEPANEHHTRRIIEILDDGVYAVHFIGHGGRYIWRTGPPDLEKNHDLFTLEHLDQLVDNPRLPVVLSLTCYSAPFDHPTADSIGEKLIRIPGRGAIAVFAASWRNSPSPNMGELLLSELTIPGNTIGEAIQRAKAGFGSDEMLVQTYNLLGDPAVPVGAPAHLRSISVDETERSLTIHVEMQEPVGVGSLVADWVAEDGSSLGEDLFDVSGSHFSVSVERGVLEDRGSPAGIRVYVWDEERRIDGIGWVDLSAGERPEDPAMSDGESVIRNEAG